MDYFDETRAAVEWKTTREQVAAWCAKDLLPGAKLIKGRWLIPPTALRPPNEDFICQRTKPVAKPFLKWAGGKKQVLDQIRARYPDGLGRKFTRYAEPFVGSGAVLFDVLSRYELKDVYIGDTNRELIACYEMVRDKVDEVTQILSKLKSDYLPAEPSERKELYTAARNRFNLLKRESILDTELAALFIFLNHTCFNGLYRVNSDGDFNVPTGKYKSPNICDDRNLKAVSKALAGVTITQADYSKSLKFINSNCFVYIDPPYRPLSSTSSFTSYGKDAFGDLQQAELAKFVDTIVKKGAYVLVSNSDPKNTDPKDNFFDQLYVQHSIERIKAVRVINSVPTGRGAITELLIVGHKK